MEREIAELTEEEVQGFLGTPEQEEELENFMQKGQCPCCD